MSTNFVRTVLLVVVLLAQSLVAHAALRLDTPVPVGPQVKVGKLANGLTYYIQRNARPAQKLELARSSRTTTSKAWPTSPSTWRSTARPTSASTNWCPTCSRSGSGSAPT
jgi:hypothetical protein